MDTEITQDVWQAAKLVHDLFAPHPELDRVIFRSYHDPFIGSGATAFLTINGRPATPSMLQRADIDLLDLDDPCIADLADRLGENGRLIWHREEALFWALTVLEPAE